MFGLTKKMSPLNPSTSWRKETINSHNQCSEKLQKTRWNSSTLKRRSRQTKPSTTGINGSSWAPKIGPKISRVSLADWGYDSPHISGVMTHPTKISGFLLGPLRDLREVWEPFPLWEPWPWVLQLWLLGSPELMEGTTAWRFLHQDFWISRKKQQQPGL